MAGQEQQPDWLNLPTDLLVLIGQRSRDAVTGLAAFRSVCRTWRAAVGPAPRLLLPRAGSSLDPTLVFPLARGWSIVVDARDASCHLSHLATGATAALPKLNAVRDRHGSRITHLVYEHRPDEYTAIHSWAFYRSYISFTDNLRFAVHALPDDSPAVAAAGMTIMMYHFMQGRTGMLFCRPGDAAWTKVKRPNPLESGYFDFVYHDGRMFGMGANGQMAVYDAATLDVLHLVAAPPVPSKLVSKMYGITTKMYGVVVDLKDYDYVNLISLPSKVILVGTSVKSSLPVAFSIFELGSTHNGGLAWHKVTNAGNYDLFLDRYHTTFWENGSNSGTRIYYVHDDRTSMLPSITSVYYYSMQDSKLECVFRLRDDARVYSTKASWFIP